jgi:hypothetical protein
MLRRLVAFISRSPWFSDGGLPPSMSPTVVVLKRRRVAAFVCFQSAAVCRPRLLSSVQAVAAPMFRLAVSRLSTSISCRGCISALVLQGLQPSCWCTSALATRRSREQRIVLLLVGRFCRTHVGSSTALARKASNSSAACGGLLRFPYCFGGFVAAIVRVSLPLPPMTWAACREQFFNCLRRLAAFRYRDFRDYLGSQTGGRASSTLRSLIVWCFSTERMPGKKRPLGDIGSSAVAQLLHTGNVSITGLSTILKTVRDSASEVHVSRAKLAEVNLERFLGMRHIEQVPLVNGGHWEWELVDPCILLSAAVEHKRSLSELYTRAVADSPPSLDRPWSLVVAYDEFVPGNKLQPDNRRKTMVLSFTFKELGQVALYNGAAWLVPVCVRHSEIAALRGGWSHLLRLFLRRILFGPSGLATSGAPVRLLDGRTVLVFARVTNILSDGEGLKLGFDWKGHASLKPCFKHYNVFKKDPAH